MRAQIYLLAILGFGFPVGVAVFEFNFSIAFLLLMTGIFAQGPLARLGIAGLKIIEASDWNIKKEFRTLKETTDFAKQLGFGGMLAGLLLIVSEAKALGWAVFIASLLLRHIYRTKELVTLAKIAVTRPPGGEKPCDKPPPSSE